MRAVLIGSAGPILGHEYALTEPVTTIGRRDENTIVIKDPTVSRHHAEIRRDGDSFSISDKQSTSGVTVNGEQITGEHHLHDGDRIGIGISAVFLVQIQAQEGQTLAFSSDDLAGRNQTQFITRTDLTDPRAQPSSPETPAASVPQPEIRDTQLHESVAAPPPAARTIPTPPIQAPPPPVRTPPPEMSERPDSTAMAPPLYSVGPQHSVTPPPLSAQRPATPPPHSALPSDAPPIVGAVRQSDDAGGPDANARRPFDNLDVIDQRPTRHFEAPRSSASDASSKMPAIDPWHVRPGTPPPPPASAPRTSDLDSILGSAPAAPSPYPPPGAPVPPGAPGQDVAGPGPVLAPPKRSNTGLIIGIIVAIVFVVILLLAIVAFLAIRSRI